MAFSRITLLSGPASRAPLLSRCFSGLASAAPAASLRPSALAAAASPLRSAAKAHALPGLASAVVIPRRGMASIKGEYRRPHMDEYLVPQGSWQEAYDANVKKNNRIMFGGIAFLMFTLAFNWYFNVTFLIRTPYFVMDLDHLEKNDSYKKYPGYIKSKAEGKDE